MVQTDKLIIELKQNFTAFLRLFRTKKNLVGCGFELFTQTAKETSAKRSLLNHKLKLISFEEFHVCFNEPCTT